MQNMLKPNKFDIWLARLDPTIGSEMQKTRPVVIISPNITNKRVNIVTVVPMTSKIKKHPFRVPLFFNGRPGQIVIEEVRTIDKSRLIKFLGALEPATAEKSEKLILDYFSYKN